MKPLSIWRRASVALILSVILRTAAIAVAPAERSGAPAALIPYPQKVQWFDKQFDLNDYAVVCYPPEISADIASIKNTLERILQDAGAAPAQDGGNKRIRLILDKTAAFDCQEAYTLNITSERVDLKASGPAGLFYAVQTLRQLIQHEHGRVVFPGCEIADWPAFAHRGLMHDVGRNFQDVELIKRQLDMMAIYKLNLFHFHLTDYPGYRIECKVYPQLNDPNHYRATRQPGKFYTYEQLNDIIDYARQRYIQIVPEIDMPGHSDYFTTTFGFDMQDERGIAILKEILEEFFEHIDTPWFHTGSDEVAVTNPAFMKEMADFIRGYNKRLLVWRPGHLPDHNVITQLWTGQARPIPGVAYLDSQANYINHMDPFDGPVRVFFQQPCRTPTGNELALGGILCHWPDVNIGSQMDIYAQSPVFPAMVAYAERIWRGRADNREDLWGRLPSVEDPAFDEYAAFEADMITHRDRFFNDLPFPYVRQTDIPWKLIGPFDHKGDPRKTFPVEQDIRDEYMIEGKTYRWTQGRGGTIHINHFFGFAGHLPAVQSGTAYGLTYVHSDTDRTAAFWIGFNGPSRSERRRGAPNPHQGQWSNVYSAIWINDQPIDPPIWKQPGLGNDPERPFVDEDYFYRDPVQVPLKAGWNKILVKAAKASPAWKWMFTCVPIEWDGKRAAEAGSLRFSTTPN